MFSGCKINSSLAPNSYPSKLRHSKTALLEEVYDYLDNDYAFEKPLKGVELFDSLIESNRTFICMYRKTLESIGSLLRQELER